MKGVFQRWTVEQKLEVRTRLLNKEPMGDIAKALVDRFPTVTYKSIRTLVKNERWGDLTADGWWRKGAKKFEWDPAWDEPMLALRQLGQGCNPTAAKLGELGIQVSPKAVTRRLKELGLSTATPKGRAAAKPVQQPKVPKPPKEQKPRATQSKPAARLNPPQAHVRSAIPLALKKRRCQFPIGDPRADDFRFCGEPSVGTYCEEHHALCYLRPKAGVKIF